MPALFSRNKTWATLEVIRASDLNDEFDNILNNLIPSQIDDYSTSLAESQIQTDPQNGSSLSTSLAGEIERIRHQLSAIIGETYWYEEPELSLKGLNYAKSSLLWYFPFDKATNSDIYNRGAHPVAQFNDVSTVSLDSPFDTTNKKFGAASFSPNGTTSFPNSDSVFAVNSNSTRPDVGTFSCHFRNLTANECIAYNPLLGIQLDVTNTGKLEATLTRKEAATETTKTETTITGSTTISASSSFKNVILKYSINEILGSTTDRLLLKLDNADEGTQLTGQSYSINSGKGGYWFLGAKRNDPTWDKFSAMSVLPSDEAVSPWTAQGDVATACSVSGGVLTIDTKTGSVTDDKAFFQASPSLSDFSVTGATLEWKMKADEINYASGVEHDDSPLSVFIAEATGGNMVSVAYDRLGLTMYDNSVSSSAVANRLNMDVFEWHVYRLVIKPYNGSGWAFLYVDGVLSLRLKLVAATAISDVINFGDFNVSTADHTSISQWEYFKYSIDEEVEPVLQNSNDSNLDDCVMFESITNDSIDTIIQNNPVSNIVNDNRVNRLPPHSSLHHLGQVNTAIGSTTAAVWQDLSISEDDIIWFYTDGIGTVDIDLYGKWRPSAVPMNCGIVMSIDGAVGNNPTDDLDAASTVVSLLPYYTTVAVSDPGNRQFVLTWRGVLKAGLHSIRILAAGDAINVKGTQIYPGTIVANVKVDYS